MKANPKNCPVEYVADAGVWRCPECDWETKPNRFGPDATIRRACPMAKDPDPVAKSGAERLGVTWADARHYVAAIIRWTKAGWPSRSDEEVARLLVVCGLCQHEIDGRCGECRCRVNLGPALTNKARMATEDCPLGKWAPGLTPRAAAFVYPYLAHAAVGDELLYSVRSVVANYIGRADVWIVGDRPAWWRREDRFISCPRVPGGARLDRANKLKIAVETEAIPDEFFWMQDDIYLVKPVDYAWLATNWTRSPKPVSPGWLEAWKPKLGWHRQKRRTWLALHGRGQPLFDTAAHVPRLYRKAAVHAMIRDYDLLRTHHVDDLVYGNEYAGPDATPTAIGTQCCRINGRVDDAELQRRLAPAQVHNHVHGQFHGAIRANLAKTFSKPTELERMIDHTTPVGLSLAAMQDAPTMRLWTYWDGPKPPFIELCLETIRRHNPDAEILDAESFRGLMVHDKDVDYSHLKLAHQADWIRVYLLRHFGGLWLDADCIVLRPLDRFLDAVRCCWLLTYYEQAGTIGGGLLGAPPASYHIAEIYAHARRVVMERRKLKNWREILGQNVERVVAAHSWEGVFRADWHQFIPVMPHLRDGTMFSRGTDDEHHGRFNDMAFTYMLSHNTFPPELKHLSREEILDGDWFISYLFRRSLGHAKNTKNQAA